MTTRRSRPPRSRKSRTAEPQTPKDDVAALPALSAHALGVLDGPVTDPTETSQLRALEAGWDELLT
jgi:hypothetical protein